MESVSVGESKEEARKRKAREYARWYYHTKVKKTPDLRVSRARAKKEYYGALRHTAAGREKLSAWERAKSVRSKVLTQHYRKTDPVGYKTKRLYGATKTLAGRQGLPFSLDMAALRSRVEAGACECSGIPLDLTPVDGGPAAPRIIRVDPGQGFTESNIRVVASCYARMHKAVGPKVIEQMALGIVSRL